MNKPTYGATVLGRKQTRAMMLAEGIPLRIIDITDRRSNKHSDQIAGTVIVDIAGNPLRKS